MDTVTIFDAKTDSLLRDSFIKEHIPFIIYTTSSAIGRYISIENDEEFSIALEAFNAAIDTYKPDQSKFETYATTVIKNKLIDYHRGQKKHYGHEALDEDLAAPMKDDDLRLEIVELSHQLKKFDLTFDDLVEISPRHYDTRVRAINVGIEVSKVKRIMEEIYRTFKLPVGEILKVVKSTRRFVYLHRQYILTVAIIFNEELSSLQSWILETLKGDENGSSKS